MKTQTPDVVWPDEYGKAVKAVDHAKAKLSAAIKTRDKARKNALIKCCRCASEHPITTQVYIQTHWYTRSHGCTGGDYWNTGEANWECPKCGFKNRFNTPGNTHCKEFERPELVALRDYFAKVRDCYCDYDGICDSCRESAKGGTA